MVTLVAVFAFFAVGLLAWAGLSAVFSDERTVMKRLSGLTSYESSQAAAAHPQLKPFSQRVLAPGGEQVKLALGSIAPAEYRGRVRQKLTLAGSPRGMDADRFVVIKLLVVVAVGALALAVAVFINASALQWLLLAALSVASFWLPDLWLSSAVSARQKQIRLALPDMLDMLTISVEAGLGFDQAISKIVRTSHGPLSEEFGRMLQEIQAGTDRPSALKRMTARTEVPELNAFVTAIVQAEQLGIPVANVLRVQAKEMRLTRRQRAEEQGQKTPVKIVFPLILCILPATLIVILGPAAVSIGKVFGAW